MVCGAFTLRPVQPSATSSPHDEQNLHFLPSKEQAWTTLEGNSNSASTVLGPNNDSSTRRFWEIKQLICNYEDVRLKLDIRPLASKSGATK